MKTPFEFTMFVVQTSSGLFFQKASSDNTWGPDIAKARAYSRKVIAGAIVDRYIDLDDPQEGPFIVEFKCSEVCKHDYSEDIEKKRQKSKLRKEKADVRAKEEELKRLEKGLKEAQRRLAQAKG